jgi:hypothetical protein
MIVNKLSIFDPSRSGEAALLDSGLITPSTLRTKPPRPRVPRASQATARRRRRPLIYSGRPYLRFAVDRHIVLSAVETPDQAVNLVAGFPAEPPSYSAKDCLGSMLVKLGAASSEPSNRLLD